MVNPTLILYQFLLLSFIISHAGGKWDLLLSNIGISAMHVQLLRGLQHLSSLPAGRRCRTNDRVLNPDCTAKSVEYDVANNTVRPDGTLVQTGGTGPGERFVHSDNSCNWNEVGEDLVQPRWYATNQKLADGRAIIVGGLNQ